MQLFKITILSIILNLLSFNLYAYISRQEFNQLLHRAKVWLPTSIEQKNLLTGPVRPEGYKFLEQVKCNYIKTKLGGTTQKFLCRDQKNGNVIKVKFGRHSKEVYGEILGSRLLWALGFGHDDNYAAIVQCKGCPDKVTKHGELVSEDQNIYQFDPATIEIRNNKNQIETNKDSGWQWSYDLTKIRPFEGGASKAEVDAFQLLAAFIYHWDNKPSNQRVVCLDEDISSLASCKIPFLMIHDLGSTFGGSAPFWNPKKLVELKEWKKRNVWFNKESCISNLGNLNKAKISEAGRALLAELLSRLSRKQIEDLFIAARVELLSLEIIDDGIKRRATINDWVDAFENKRNDIINHQCPF